MTKQRSEWEDRAWKIALGLLWPLLLMLAGWMREIDATVREFDGDHKVIDKQLEFQNKQLDRLIGRLDRLEERK